MFTFSFATEQQQQFGAASLGCVGHTFLLLFWKLDLVSPRSQLSAHSCCYAHLNAFISIIYTRIHTHTLLHSHANLSMHICIHRTGINPGQLVYPWVDQKFISLCKILFFFNFRFWMWLRALKWMQVHKNCCGSIAVVYVKWVLSTEYWQCMCVLLSNLNLNPYFAFYCCSSPSCYIQNTGTHTHTLRLLLFVARTGMALIYIGIVSIINISHALAPNYSLWFLLPVNQDTFFESCATILKHTHRPIRERSASKVLPKVDMYTVRSYSQSVNVQCAWVWCSN